MKKIIRNSLFVTLVFIGVITYLFSNQTKGFRAFIVISSSMEPQLPTGSLLLTQYTKPSNLQKGDIITFLPPITKRELVTHRITKVTKSTSLSTFKTKGDNNKQEDKWILAGGAIIGKVVLVVPGIGYLFSFIQSKLGILLFVLLPAILLILNEIQNILSLFKNHKKEKIQRSYIDIVELFFFIHSLILLPHSTHAFLIDNAILTNNILVTLPCKPHDNGQNKKICKHHPNNDNAHVKTL